MAQSHSAQTVIVAKKSQRHWLIPLVVVLLLVSVFGVWFYSNYQAQRLQVARSACTMMSYAVNSDPWTNCVTDQLR